MNLKRSLAAVLTSGVLVIGGAAFGATSASADGPCKKTASVSAQWDTEDPHHPSASAGTSGSVNCKI